MCRSLLTFLAEFVLFPPSPHPRARQQDSNDRAPEGKFKVRNGTGVIETTILPDQVLELRMRDGQVHVLRRRKLFDPEDEKPSWDFGGEMTDVI
jgi:hypothetical protein